MDELPADVCKLIFIVCMQTHDNARVLFALRYVCPVWARVVYSSREYCCWAAGLQLRELVSRGCYTLARVILRQRAGEPKRARLDRYFALFDAILCAGGAGTREHAEIIQELAGSPQVALCARVLVNTRLSADAESADALSRNSRWIVNEFSGLAQYGCHNAGAFLQACARYGDQDDLQFVLTAILALLPAKRLYKLDAALRDAGVVVPLNEYYAAASGPMAAGSACRLDEFVSYMTAPPYSKCPYITRDLYYAIRAKFPAWRWTPADAPVWLERDRDSARDRADRTN